MSNRDLLNEYLRGMMNSTITGGNMGQAFNYQGSISAQSQASLPRPRPMEVKSRSPMFNIQIIRRATPDGEKAFVAIGLDGMESLQLGPYDADITLPQALALVSTDLRMDDKLKICDQFTKRTA